MKLSALVTGLPISGAPPTDLEVSGIAYDSRRTVPGDLFVTWAGVQHDGRAFAADAITRGAVAVLAAGPAPAGIVAPWLTAAEPRRLLGPLAVRLYDRPHERLVLAGVTGTNGKSTVVALLGAILDAAGRPAGSIGTLGYHFRELTLEGERTTPEASDLFAALRAMHDHGAEAVAMEVSSHALVQGRVEGAAFDLALFTNLTRDHFDFHRDFEDYFAAKRRLFSMLKPGGRAVVNVDDPYGRRFAAELPEALTYGEQGEVRAEEVELDARGIRGQLRTPRGSFPFRSPLLGAYNLWNLVAAAAGAEALGVPHAAIAAGIAARGSLPGRMQAVDCGQGFPVLIDFAHTDAALEAALRSVRALAGRRIAVVFGCGGNKDAGKRALMGRVAGELAELPIVTSDNPRDEDPLAIIAAVEQGLQASGNPDYRIMPDRREAIRRAVAVADAGEADPLAERRWALLVAGKGHEEEQIVRGVRHHFSDREELVKALEERRGRAQAG